MDIRKNNAFVAFALWAGAWSLIQSLEYLSFEIYIAAQDKTDGPFWGSLEQWPVFTGFLSLLIVARAWRDSISLLLIAFITLDIFWAILSYSDSAIFFLLCSPDVCTWGFRHDFQLHNTVFGFFGYMVAAIAIQAWRIGLTPKGLASRTRNPLAYVANLVAQLAAKLVGWLELDVAGIKALWSRWAELPLWRSGSFLARNIGPVWVAFFGLAAASTFAVRFFQTLLPFWTIAGMGDLTDESTLAAVWSSVLLTLLTVAVSWKAGRLVADLGWTVSAWAAIPSVLLVSFFTIFFTVELVIINRADPFEVSLILMQNLIETTTLYFAFVISHRLATGRTVSTSSQKQP